SKQDESSNTPWTRSRLQVYPLVPTAPNEITSCRQHQETMCKGPGARPNVNHRSNSFPEQADHTQACYTYDQAREPPPSPGRQVIRNNRRGSAVSKFPHAPTYHSAPSRQRNEKRAGEIHVSAIRISCSTK